VCAEHPSDGADSREISLGAVALVVLETRNADGSLRSPTGAGPQRPTPGCQHVASRLGRTDRTMDDDWRTRTHGMVDRHLSLEVVAWT
jgi:hypothetical protein